MTVAIDDPAVPSVRYETLYFLLHCMEKEVRAHYSHECPFRVIDRHGANHAHLPGVDVHFQV